MRGVWTDSAILRVCTQQRNEITSLVIPDSVTYIGDAAFQASAWLKTKITSVVIGNSVTSIGDEAFISGQLEFGYFGQSYFRRTPQDNKITSVEFGNSVTHIGKRAFAASPRPSLIFAHAGAIVD